MDLSPALLKCTPGDRDDSAHAIIPNGGVPPPLLISLPIRKLALALTCPNVHASRDLPGLQAPRESGRWH